MPDLDATTELLRAFGDPMRVRLLALLAAEELTVAELTSVTQLAQSRVSSHLGRLRDADLVRDRRAGAASYYALNLAGMPDHAKRAWSVISTSIDDPMLAQDRARLKEIVRARSNGSSWADSVAGRMERHYSPGRTWEAALRGVLGVVRLGDVLDVASGDGALAELLAPRARSIACLDASEKVVAAARARFSDVKNVRAVHGDMHALPFADGAFDQLLLMNCLTCTKSPKQVVHEAARVARPGADLAAVTLKAHKHEQAARAFDHVRLGFTPRELKALFQGAGLDVSFCEVTSREKRPPNFEVVTLFATKPKKRSQR